MPHSHPILINLGLNLPGPVAAHRLSQLGLKVIKIEPPSGDPLRRHCAKLYWHLHQDSEIIALDLKEKSGQEAFAQKLKNARILLSSFRPQARAKLGLDDATLFTAHPQLYHLAIVGSPPPRENTPGHDLLYQAKAGYLTGNLLPINLFADMAGAGEAVIQILKALYQDLRGKTEQIDLESALHAEMLPHRYGLTQKGGLLGGGLGIYNIYLTQTAPVALAALESHFQTKLCQVLNVDNLQFKTLQAVFLRKSAAEWESLARTHDLPLVTIKVPICN